MSPEAAYRTRYVRTERALPERVAWSDDRLPSDTELCQAYRVSRMTAPIVMQRIRRRR